MTTLNLVSYRVYRLDEIFMTGILCASRAKVQTRNVLYFSSKWKNCVEKISIEKIFIKKEVRIDFLDKTIDFQVLFLYWFSLSLSLDFPCDFVMYTSQSYRRFSFYSLLESRLMFRRLAERIFVQYARNKFTVSFRYKSGYKSLCICIACNAILGDRVVAMHL